MLLYSTPTQHYSCLKFQVNEVKKYFGLYLTVPDAPPESLKAWNLSSTSLYVQWDPIPLEYRNGKILRYKLEMIAEEQSRKRHKVKKYTQGTSLTLWGLQKYSKYEVTVSGITRRGQGPTQSTVVQTDEDGKTRHKQ